VVFWKQRQLEFPDVRVRIFYVVVPVGSHFLIVRDDSLEMRRASNKLLDVCYDKQGRHHGENVRSLLLANSSVRLTQPN